MLMPNNSFKPTPHRGVNSVLYATLHAVATPLRRGLTQALGPANMSRGKPTYTDPWYAKPGFVYFIGAGDPLKAIKIGVTLTTSFKSRLRGHQSSNHEPLRVLGIIEFSGPDRNMRTAEQLERSLHKQFAAHQRFQAAWVGSEWFNPHQDLLDYIHSNCTSCLDFGLPESVAKHGPGLSCGA
jgi:T5orf172 domain